MIENKETYPGSIEIRDGLLVRGKHLSGKVSLPEGITDIGSNAFLSSRMTAVRIPEGVTRIGKLAFADCRLEEVELPESLKFIEDGAFSSCWRLKSIRIPDSVEKIGCSAFHGCSALKEVRIPPGIRTIERAVFCECTELRKIQLPEGLAAIEEDAFNGCQALEQVTIPKSTWKIGPRAFQNCRSLTGLELPSRRMKLGVGAFYGCEGLADQGGLVIIRGILFHCLHAEEDFSVPEGIERIDANAFQNNEALVRLWIPDSTVSIGKGAFSGCKNLAAVRLPQRLDQIEDEAFSGCRALADPEGFVIVRGSLYSYYGEDEIVRVPDRVSRIGAGAFRENFGIREVEIPDSVREIGEKAFFFCQNLQTVRLPNRLACLRTGTFSECRRLSEILLPEGLVEIEDEAFYGCTRLRTAELPDSLRFIGDRAFAKCHTLAYLMVPDAVSCIGKGAFYRCIRLSSFHLPREAESIGDQAFEGTMQLEEFWPEGTRGAYTVWQGILFDRDKRRLIHYPKMRSGEVLTLPETVTCIEEKAFVAPAYLKELRLPEGFKEMRYKALQSNKIRYIRLPKGLKSLPRESMDIPFAGCFSPSVAARVPYPVYFGNIDDLPPDLRSRAARGFLYAAEHGIHEIMPYRASYRAYILENAQDLMAEARDSRPLLLTMVKEEALPEKEARDLLRVFLEKKDTEAAGALLQYLQEKGSGETDGDLSVD